MNVLITFDVEVWCNSWHTLDADFPSCFERYAFGRSARGDFALPRTLEVLERHGLKAVFFVEPLFAARFGLEPLAAIVDLIRDAGQEIQLHLHPEWTDEATTPLLPDVERKRQYLHYYTEPEQIALIGHGLRLMREVGVDSISAFRAGSFACNESTLRAVACNGLAFDSSINPAMSVSLPGSASDPKAGPSEPFVAGGLNLYPLTVFCDGFGRMRHAQVGACAAQELIEAMTNAAQGGWKSFVLLSHNFEMLVPGKTKPDPVVVRRFEALCAHLAHNRHSLPTAGFGDLGAPPPPRGLGLPRVGARATAMRYVEQAIRRFH